MYPLSNHIGAFSTFEVRYRQPKRYSMGLDTTGIVRTGITYDIDWPDQVCFIIGERLYNAGYRMRFLSLEQGKEITFGYSQRTSLVKSTTMSGSGLSLESGDVVGLMHLSLGGNL